MSAHRILVKLSHPPGAQPDTSGFAAAGMPLRKLFDTGRDASGQGGAFSAGAAAGQAAWYLAGAEDVSDSFSASEPDHPAGDAWDTAHGLVRDGMGMAGGAVLMAEPDRRQRIYSGLPADSGLPVTGRSNPGTPAAQMGFPYVPGPGFNWHQDDAYTGLRTARDSLGVTTSGIIIAHLDTGYDRTHKARPAHILKEHSFIKGEAPDRADDRTPAGGMLRNRGHGTGTIGILAGGLLHGMRPADAEGVLLGAAAPMQVIPVRVADSVVGFWTSAIAEGIDFARMQGADVVSMSMGGLPSAAWADAVNAAYDAGVVVVCAAGNSFGGLPTSLTVYPARFNRVIAACGAMADGNPYFHIPANKMEGNAGPGSKMRTAMSAFTPNIPWARFGTPDLIDLDGAGTSAATPQVAAAAALWLHRNGAAFPKGSWQRAEAARQALFRAARGKGGVDPLLGNGLLRAPEALAMAGFDDLQAEPPDSASFAFLHLLTSVFGVADPGGPAQAMLALELTQVALTSGAARDAMPDPDLPASAIPEAKRRRFLEAILDEEAILGQPRCSKTLTRFLEQVLGRSRPSPAPDLAPAVKAIFAKPASAAPAPRGAVDTRELLPPPPPSRRLRIYATDPGDGQHLRTAFINTAVVEVPWERAPGVNNLLQPGPVGEYLEVVDVDPASGAAYAPVDLNDPFLLAQDGLPPSEGTPGFHQQMVYAVAMRTIGAFERALGRRALWATRRIETGTARNGVKAYREVFVRRLRLYPHALRQANAYYSPARVALLFGYFPANSGRRLVFTCLSHDVVAHETTHALLDGMHRRYQEATNPDVHAFHEAFADIVAIFQHFTFPELLRFEIAEVQGKLELGVMLAGLAREFGAALGRKDGLRNAIGKTPTPTDYADATEPHDRGAVLVAAVFEAFLAIYARRTADLLRIATGGSGVLRQGALHPDLVERLASEAVKTARHVLGLCIRALDYMPPVDPTFPEYLRALVTADSDLVPNDRFGYRVALLEAFGRRGIQPDELRTLSEESLRWQTVAPDCQPRDLGRFLREKIDLYWDMRGDRLQSWTAAKSNAALLHNWLQTATAPGGTQAVFAALGLDRSPAPADGSFDPYAGRRDAAGLPGFEVHAVRPARRATPDGDVRTDIIAVITQKQVLADGTVRRGGCTLVMDRREGIRHPIRYAVVKPLGHVPAAPGEAPAAYGAETGLRTLYFGSLAGEPFAMLHSHAC